MILVTFLAIAEEFQLKGLMRPMNYDEVDKEEILGKEIVIVIVNCQIARPQNQKPHTSHKMENNLASLKMVEKKLEARKRANILSRAQTKILKEKA